MNRTHLIALTTVLACGLVIPAGIASAQDSPAPTASGSPASPAASPASPAVSPAASPTSTSSPSPSATAGAEEPVNQAPVAVDDPAVSVVAGRSVARKVLLNDTDDGVGRPAGETPHLEVATFDTLGGRVTLDATRTVLTVTARPADARTTLSVTYTASDGTLTSAPAHAAVTVTPPPPPVRTATLTAPRPLVALHRYSLRGRVSPLPPGPVTVAVQRLVSGAWTRLGTDRADAKGAFAVRYSTSRPQRLVLRAVATWRNGAHATSSRMTRTVVGRSEAHVSGPLTRRAVPYSYRAGCPVRPSGLRRITINRFTYSHTVARGSLVVRAGAVPALLRVFRASFASHFPIRSMRPTDAFYDHGRRTPTASDVAAMRADNTSAFNCRPVTGNPYRVSQHSYGNAIDINTVRNPYVVGSRVYPSFARTYLRRSNVRTGMITRGGVIATKMRQNGWPWGARWSHPDYQHFSANGG
jgi:hypothetical protein